MLDKIKATHEKIQKDAISSEKLNVHANIAKIKDVQMQVNALVERINGLTSISSEHESSASVELEKIKNSLEVRMNSLDVSLTSALMVFLVNAVA